MWCGRLREGTVGRSCKKAAAGHTHSSNLIWRSLRRADIPTTKETTGLLRGDCKRPDDLTMVPWQSGRCLTWDASVVDTFASSYVSSTSSTPGGSAEAAAKRTLSEYFTISQTHIFNPVALKSILTKKVYDSCAHSAIGLFLFLVTQRFSVLV